MKIPIHPFDMYDLLAKATSLKELLTIDALYEEDRTMPYTGTQHEFVCTLSETK